MRPTALSRGEVLFLALSLAGGFLARWAWMAHAPFPEHFWMDERFSAAVVAQPVAKLLLFCRHDVHPPLYYLLLKAWNSLYLCFAPARLMPPLETLTAYRLPGIGREGYFTVVNARGMAWEITGLYPADWPHWPLAPLAWLRLLSIGCALANAALIWLIARLLWPAERATAALALLLTLFSPYMLTWDTVIRSYSMQALGLGALALLLVRASLRVNAECGVRNAENNNDNPFPHSDFRVPHSLRASLKEPHGARFVIYIVVALLTMTLLLTGYLLVLALPCLLGAYVLLRNASVLPASLRKKSRRDTSVSWLAAAMAAGILLAALMWGRAFLAQSALRQLAPGTTLGLPQRLASEVNQLADTHWQMLFSYGVTANLNPFSAPAGYALAFLLYAACVGGALYRLIKDKAAADSAVALLALGPSLLVVLANTLRPQSIPIEARYFYPFAPFYFLFLARGAMFWKEKCGRKNSLTNWY